MRVKRFLSGIVRNWPAKALSLAVAILLFLFHRLGTLEERYFSVPIDILLDKNLAPANAYPRMAKISVRGDKDIVFHITEEDIEAYADFSSYQTEGLFREAIQYYKKGAALENSFLEISVEPFELVLLLEEKTTREVPVIENITGFPEKGYELGQYFIEPGNILVEGPRSLIADLRSIPTQKIDISGSTSNMDIQVSLDPGDPNIRILENRNVRFTAFIQETRITRIYDPVNIILFDLVDNAKIISWIPSGQVQVQGTQLSVDKISTGDIILSGDCSAITREGDYSIPIIPVAPEGISVLSYSPDTLQIRVIMDGGAQ